MQCNLSTRYRAGHRWSGVNKGNVAVVTGKSSEEGWATENIPPPDAFGPVAVYYGVKNLDAYSSGILETFAFLK